MHLLGKQVRSPGSQIWQHPVGAGIHMLDKAPKTLTQQVKWKLHSKVLSSGALGKPNPELFVVTVKTYYRVQE